MHGKCGFEGARGIDGVHRFEVGHGVVVGAVRQVIDRGGAARQG